MRASRLLSILILLQLRGRLTAEALAEEFEVSVRTIYRDIDELSAMGIPVQSDRGPGGGFQLMDGYRTNLTGLASDEAEALFMIGMPGPAEALGLGSAAAKAGRKVLASLPAASSKEAALMTARFHLDPIDWYRAAESAKHLPAIARAVLDQNVVAMTYQSWRGTRDWVVEPLGLVLKAGAWYLVARSDSECRIFKVSNIQSQVVRNEAFERPADFDLPSHWATELERFESSLRPQAALLRASPVGLERISRLGSYAAKAVEQAEAPDPDGWVRVSLPIESVDHAALTLLGVGPEIDVLEPTALREKLQELAIQVAQRLGAHKPLP